MVVVLKWPSLAQPCALHMHRSWLYCRGEHVLHSLFTKRSVRSGNQCSHTSCFPAHGPMPGPTPPLCSSFRNTEELTALVSTGKSAWLQREQGTAVIPPRSAASWPVPCLSEQKEPAAHSRLVWRSGASRQQRRARANMQEEVWQWLCCLVCVCVCVGKGHVQQLIRGPACLPVYGLESSSIWWLRVCQLGSWGTFQPWEGASGCSHYCGCCHALAVFTCARKKKAGARVPNLSSQQNSKRQAAEQCGVLLLLLWVRVERFSVTPCPHPTMFFLLNVAVLCVLTVAV